MPTTISKKEQFAFCSKKAADAERYGQYKEAYVQWNRAEDACSPRSLNREWCHYRGKFCARMISNPF